VSIKDIIVCTLLDRKYRTH